TPGWASPPWSTGSSPTPGGPREWYRVWVRAGTRPPSPWPSDSPPAGGSSTPRVSGASAWPTSLPTTWSRHFRTSTRSRRAARAGARTRARRPTPSARSTGSPTRPCTVVRWPSGSSSEPSRATTRGPWGPTSARPGGRGTSRAGSVPPEQRVDHQIRPGQAGRTDAPHAHGTERPRVGPEGAARTAGHGHRARAPDPSEPGAVGLRGQRDSHSLITSGPRLTLDDRPGAIRRHGPAPDDQSFSSTSPQATDTQVWIRSPGL